MAYTVMIFERAKSSVDPNIASIIFGVMQVVGVWLSTIINERSGRRPLLLISAAGMALCHFALALFVLLQEQGTDVSSFKWVPMVALSTFGIAYNVGMGPIPFIVSNEMYHPEIASACNTLSMFVLFSGASVVMELFPIILNSLGLHYCFFILLCFCTCTFFFTLFVVPETRGRPIESILEELNSASKKKKPGNSSIEKWVATQT
uniref:Major facilitator superfamily (MFS) profile domain-containing protein n=1 Tax=Bracon brevicornis TaxID=1563983 RepID=A0A6V7IW00_9HYME